MRPTTRSLDPTSHPRLTNKLWWYHPRMDTEGVNFPNSVVQNVHCKCDAAALNTPSKESFCTCPAEEADRPFFLQLHNPLLQRATLA